MRFWNICFGISQPPHQIFAKWVNETENVVKMVVFSGVVVGRRGE